LIEFNEQFEKLTGWSTTELKQQEFRELLHPSERELLMQRYRLRRANQPVSERYRTALIHKDGSRIDVDLKLGSVHLASGTAIMLVINVLSNPNPELAPQMLKHPQK